MKEPRKFMSVYSVMGGQYTNTFDDPSDLFKKHKEFRTGRKSKGNLRVYKLMGVLPMKTPKVNIFAMVGKLKKEVKKNG